MPPLPADFIHARACKLKCEKILTRPIPHLESSLPLCQQRVPTPLQMALKQKSGGRIAARFVCGLGGSPFLYPLELYR